MKVQIHILNYNGRNLLEQCLPSIQKAALKSKWHPEIFVIDNQSQDSSEEFVRENFPQIKFNKMPENKVLCSFNEVGQASSADILIFLNNDLIVDDGFIDPLIEIFLNNEDAFLAAARVYNFDGSLIEDGVTRPVIRWGILKGISNTDPLSPELSQVSYTFQAGFGAFDRKKFLHLGGYDSLYLPGIMEDTDLCLRAWKNGYRSYYHPKSRIYHIGKASFTKRFGNWKLLALSHRNTYFLVWKNISSRLILAKSVIFTPLRLFYALFTLKLEIIYGFFWFVIRLPDVIRARRRENKTRKNYLFTDQEVFNIFEPAKKGRIENLIARRFDELCQTFPDQIEENDSRLKAIINQLGVLKGKKILEVGCGKGRVSRILKKQGADIYGIDISEQLLKSAKDITRSHFLKAEAYAIPFKSNYFDAVVLLEVIEHIPDLSRALKEISRVIKSDGKLVIVDRNKFSLNNRRCLVPNLLVKRYHELKNEWMYPRDFGYREIWFNPRRVKKLLAGYFWQNSYSYVLSDGEQKCWWHFIFRLIPCTRHFTLWSGEDKKTEKQINPAACYKEFGPPSIKVRERVARSPRIEAADRSNCLNGIFSLRIDADEYHSGSFSGFLELFKKYNSAITIFINVNSFEATPEEVINCQKAGLDIQSHGYYHHVYNDYQANLSNIRKAKDFFLKLGIKTKGFAAPMGKWNWNLMRALEKEAYEYSSDFSYDYLGLPSYPQINGKPAKILEIPIFPVAPELFFEKKQSELKAVIEYYKRSIDQMILNNLPVIVYGHTSVYGQGAITLLREIIEYALFEKKLLPKNLTDIARIWKENQPLANNRIEKSIFQPEILGKEIQLPLVKRIKKQAREILDPERWQLTLRRR